MGIFVVLMAALVAVGCSRFEPGQGSGNDTASDAGAGTDTIAGGDSTGDSTGDASVVDVQQADADATVGEDVADGAGDTSTDGGAGEVDAGGPDADVALADVNDADDDTLEVDDGDAGDDGDVGAADGDADTGPDPDVVCSNECPAAGQTRCADEGAALEICSVDRDGCRAWQPHVSCPTGDECEGTFVCDAGACKLDDSTALECEPSGDPCLPNICVTGMGCALVAVPEGGACDDNNVCTVLETCQAGDCTGFPNQAECDCTTDDECDEFDDGDKCNGRWLCIPQGSFSVCEPGPEELVACPDDGDPCTSLACDAGTGECSATPENTGLGCDDGDACTTVSQCDAGDCVAISDKDCGFGPCDEGSCNAETGECTSTPLPGCCGNGIAEGDEACDSGFEEGDSACTADCAIEDCQMQAMSFGGAECIQLTGSSLLQSVSELTIDFWIRPAAVEQTAGTIIGREQDPGPGSPDWGVTFTQDGTGVRLSWREGRVGLPDASVDGPALDADTWTHVAMTRAPFGGGAQIRWFVGGIDMGGGSVDEINPLPSDGVWIGCYRGLTNFFVGDLDELRIRTDIAYTSNFPPKKSPHFVDAETRALWHFDHVDAGLALDATGVHHAIWQGATPTNSTPFDDTPDASPSCDATFCHRSGLVSEAAAEGVARVDLDGALDGVQTLTVEFFLSMATPMVGEQVVVSAGTAVAGGSDWHITAVQTAGDTYRLRWYEGQIGNIDNILGTIATLPTTEVHHIAAVRTYPDADNATLSWFINGEPEPAKALSGVVEFTGQTELQVASQDGTTGFLSGMVDELHICASAKYVDGFEVPATIEPRFDTLGLYRFDVGKGVWAHPAAPSAIGALFLEGLQWNSTGAPQITACP